MNKIPPLQYGVIYADPPWKYKMYSEKGELKSPQAQYECMNFDDLVAMRDDVIFASGPNAVCVMWAIFPMLDKAIQLMNAWGFRFVTGGAWQKVTEHGKRAFGQGYVFRGSAEVFLIGAIGSPKLKNRSTRNALVTGDVPASLNDLGVSVFSKLREHSRKPDEMRVLIEELFEGPYLEMFARSSRRGWDVFGNETEKFGDAA